MKEDKLSDSPGTVSAAAVLQQYKAPSLLHLCDAYFLIKVSRIW